MIYTIKHVFMYASLNTLKNYKNKITSRVKIIGKNTVTASLG